MMSSLTPYLLTFLSKQGYRYFLSKTEVLEKDHLTVRIALTPTFKKPSLKRLPLGFDTYFEFDQEPMQMALGVDETEILVNLSEKDVKTLKLHLLQLKIGS